MTSFADTEDLDANLSDGEKQQRALDRATDLIRAATNQTITRVDDDVVTVDGAGRRILQLPQVPAIDVTSVTVDGLTLVEDLHYEVNLVNGWLTRLGASWPCGPVVVTYSHGYDTVPDELARMCAEVANRILSGTLNVRQQSESAGGVQKTITYARTSDTVFSEEEDRILDTYRVGRLP